MKLEVVNRDSLPITGEDMGDSALKKFDRVQWVGGDVGPLKTGATGHVVEPIFNGRVLVRWEDPEVQEYIEGYGVAREHLKLLDLF